MLRRFPWISAQWFFGLASFCLFFFSFYKQQFSIERILHGLLHAVFFSILDDFLLDHVMCLCRERLLLFYISCIFFSFNSFLFPACLFSLMNRHKCRFIYTLPYDCKWSGNMKIEWERKKQWIFHWIFVIFVHSTDEWKIFLMEIKREGRDRKHLLLATSFVFQLDIDWFISTSTNSIIQAIQ